MLDDTDSDRAIPPAPAPAPWNTKATMYLIPFWTSGRTAEDLPAKAYHPLELQSAFASREFGIARGGLSMIQLIRYHETPAGPYDEMVFSPGSFEYPVEGADGKKTTKKALRITRIYVSQKNTCWNGRKNWNIPKHLAHFDWIDDPSTGTTQVKVFPHDTRQPYDPSEPPPNVTNNSINNSSARTPFFQCTIYTRQHKPFRFLPSFPLSTGLLEKLPLIGLDLTLGELPGTEERVALAGVRLSSRRGRLAWGDFAQQSCGTPGVDEEQSNGGERTGREESGEFWPGLGRRWLVVKLDRGEAVFPEGRRWATPRHLL